MRNIFQKFRTKKENEKNEGELRATIDSPVRNITFITTQEACTLLQASPPTVRKYCRLGYYKSYHFGQKLVFFSKEEILAYIVKNSDNDK